MIANRVRAEPLKIKACLEPVPTGKRRYKIREPPVIVQIGPEFPNLIDAYKSEKSRGKQGYPPPRYPFKALPPPLCTHSYFS
jgi:hypothetical protein